MNMRVVRLQRHESATRARGRAIHRRGLGAALLWTLFAAGLIVQVFAPRLRIENGAFVIPQALTEGSVSSAPAEIVRRERFMRTSSALLTLSGALGLAYLYRGALIKARN